MLDERDDGELSQLLRVPEALAGDLGSLPGYLGA